MELHHCQSLSNLSSIHDATSTVLSQSMSNPKLCFFYKRHVISFWTLEEIDFQDDMKHLPNLPPDQVHFLSVVLGFFATSNKIVANNLSQNFMTVK